MVFTIAFKDPIGPDDGDQNEGNLGCCKCVILKQQNRNSAKFGDHQISQFPIFRGGNIILGDLKLWFQDEVWGGINRLTDRLESLIEKLLQHEQLLES